MTRAIRKPLSAQRRKSMSEPMKIAMITAAGVIGAASIGPVTQSLERPPPARVIVVTPETVQLLGPEIATAIADNPGAFSTRTR
jgi:hypothetical protein